MRWGSGSLQEVDHVPFVAPLTKTAETVKDTTAIPAATARAIDGAVEFPSGPTFVTDYPLDVVFMEAEAEALGARPRRRAGRRGRRAGGGRSSPRQSVRRSWPAPTCTGRAARGSSASSPRR